MLLEQNFLSMKKEIIPFGYAKSYIFKQALNKATPHQVIYHHNVGAYSDLKRGKIYLPFIEPLDLGDLKVILKHEEGHFKITKDEAIIPLTMNIIKARKVLNILEDILVNEEMSKNKLEKVFKKMGGESLQITLWKHYSKKEKEKLINKLKGKLFKYMDTEKITKTIEETVKDRKSFDSVNKFVSSHFSVFEKFYDIFENELPKDIPGSGPGDYTRNYCLPDPKLVKKIEKILKNLKVNLEEITHKEHLYGKRINRKYFEDILCIKPFIQQEAKQVFLRPKVLILLDCSGSMLGQPEVKAKSFIEACLNTLDCKVIGHNQCYHVITDNKEEINKLPMTGDEWFNKLKPEDYSCDVFVVMTDLNIDNGEADGLFDFGKSVKAKYKYLLCCSLEHYLNYDNLNAVFKRYYVGKPKQYIEFAKKLANNLI